MNDVIHCFPGRHNQLPHDRKDSNNLRHADRNLAQNEVSRAHQINFSTAINFRLNLPATANVNRHDFFFFLARFFCEFREVRYFE